MNICYSRLLKIWLVFLFVILLFLSHSVTALQINITLFTVDVAEDVWKSTNSGVNWTAVNTSFSGATNDATVMAMNASRNLFIIDAAEDVWTSFNQGVHWKNIASNFNGGNGDILALAIDSNNTLYAIDTAEDVWISYDSGFTWNILATNFNGGNGDIGGLTVMSNGTLFTADVAEDVWKSTNSGVNWTAVNTSFSGGTNNPVALAVNSSSALFIIDTVEDVWVSSDQGVSWTRTATNFNGANGDPVEMVIDANNTFYIIDTAEDVWASYDSGFTWNTIAANMNGGNGDVGGLAVFLNSTDIYPPLFANISATPTNNSNYSLPQLYTFNVTISDDISVDEVTIVFNNTNYSSKAGWISNLSNVYTFNRTGLGAASYPYLWIANDTSGNRNQTPLQLYTVNRAPSLVNLTLNGNTENLTVLPNTLVNITATRIFGEENIQLFVNGSLHNQGATVISNLTMFSGLGNFNITSLYAETKNFTSNFITSYLLVQDTIAPTSNSPPDAIYLINETKTIDWVVIDNYAPGYYVVTRNGVIVNASSWINNTNLAIPLNTTTEGLWNYTIAFNDSVGNNGLPDIVLINITLNYTNIQPVVTLQNPLNNSFLSTASVLLQSRIYDDNLDLLTVFVYGDDVLLTSFSNQSNGTAIIYNWTNVSEGIHNWTMIASDGNMNSTKLYLFFITDQTLPTLTLLSPQNNSSFISNESIALNYSSTDLYLDKTWYNLDFGQNITVTENVTFNTTYGLHTLSLFANDSVGNIGTTSAFFTVVNTSNTSSGGSSSGSSVSSSSASVGNSGLDAFRENPGAIAPRPQLPSTPTPPRPPSSSPQQPATGETEPQKTVQAPPAVTGSAIGSTVKKTATNISLFLLGLAILAAVLSLLLRKRKHPATAIIAREEKPMQFTVQKQQPSLFQQKIRHVFISLQQAIRHRKEAQQRRQEHLNIRTAAKKIMVKPLDSLHQLEGLISQEFIHTLRKKSEGSQQKITPQEFKQHFPETSKELQQKGLETPLLAADRQAFVPKSLHLEEKKQIMTTTELKKLFPETLGKAEEMVAEKKIILPSAKPRLPQQTKQHDPTFETFTFKKAEKPVQTEAQTNLSVNRKINKKTEKNTMLKGLEEVYDLA